MVMHLLRYKKMVIQQLIESGCNWYIGFSSGPMLGKGNTTIPVRGDYLIGLGIRSTTAAGLAGGSIATGIIIVAEVINDCMSSQRTDSSKDETDPPSTHGTRSPTSMLLTKGTTRMLCYGVLVNVWKSAAMLCLLCF
ncbi:hypothetical protein Tco_0635415 [Tanacetum coccineum]